MIKLNHQNHSRLRTWVEIDTEKIKQNLKELRKMIGEKVALGVVTKSNAYGHGLVEFSAVAESLGTDLICVDSVMEARELRLRGIKTPILVMGYTLPINFDIAKEHDLTLTISSSENLEKVTSEKAIKHHLKFDTGFSRQGFLEKDLESVLKILNKSSENLVGVYTHFANAKVPSERDETDKQLSIFKRIVGQIKQIKPDLVVHAAATAGTIVYPESRLDLVRVGIGSYGLWPDPAVKEEFSDRLSLKPVLAWKTIISEVKVVRKGEGVGYYHAHKLKKDSILAVCPVGYWHGYLRALSNKSEVLVRGKRAPLRGNVSMGMMVADVSDIKGVKAGDEVVLIGAQGDEEITADELADLAGTINYEIVTRINPYSKRFYF